jgi:hypothetical protein
MLTNKSNQLVLIAKESVRRPIKESNLIPVKAELYGDLDDLRRKTGLTMREIVFTMLEYALENTEIIE